MKTRCQGILGWLFGHRFFEGTWLTDLYSDNYCSRCGMPKGGWDREALAKGNK